MEFGNPGRQNYQEQNICETIYQGYLDLGHTTEIKTHTLVQGQTNLWYNERTVNLP